MLLELIGFAHPSGAAASDALMRCLWAVDVDTGQTGGQDGGA